MDNFISDLQQELNQLSKELEIIGDSINKITNKISDTAIGFGSRVLIEWENQKPQEGRVLEVKHDGRLSVNRDGYAGTINVGINHDGLTKHTIQNLSVGTFGKLEKLQWLNTVRANKIKLLIQERVNTRVEGIKQSLKDGISLNDGRKIINLQDFKSWYKRSDYEKSISLSDLSQSHSIFICAVAREFLKTATNEMLYETIIKDKV